LEDFEAGKRVPSFRQTEQLAALYNIPIYLLYLDASPNLELTLPDFRRTNPRPADLSPGGLARIWAVEKVSTFTSQLKGELSGEMPTFKKLPPTNQLSAAYAHRLRGTYDSWFLSRQKRLSLSGSPEAQTLTGLRLFFESCGALSSVNDAPASDYMGFYSEPQGGLRSIFVNRKISSKKAQLFTFVHELAHSLIGEEGISDPFSAKNQTERRCNNFAAEFLAPRDQFKALVEGLHSGKNQSTLKLIRAVSDKSLLSNQATAIRLLEHDYINRADYALWRKMWRTNPAVEKMEEKEGAPAGGPGAFAKRVGELGFLAVYVAALGVRQKIVDSIDVQRGLNLSEGIQEKAFSLAVRRLEAAID
jgi:Zn-dependent peptidase ImmA (M78 family)